jgi:predicted dehydrogenase/GNAT superfamily N-acetyltransferase
LKSQIKVGIVGAAGRGGSFRDAFEANGARIQAVCDLRKETLAKCKKDLGAKEAYGDYEEMLDKAALDAVVVGTPMQFHVPHSIAALKRGLHVLCEVPAGVSVAECRELVKTCRESEAIYMMAENYTYIKTNVLVRELARKGLFGQPYYAEGEYLHDCKELNEETPWRRIWQTGLEGVTYGTHSLGPILQWMPGDRVAKVCVGGSGWHHKDPRGKRFHQDTAVMLCKTVKGALIKIRVDMVSERPHAMTNYQLQGTKGCYESSRGNWDGAGKIWLESLAKEPDWFDVEAGMRPKGRLAKHLPLSWRKPSKEALKAGHGGGDFFEVGDFLDAVRGKKRCPIGIHEAMDMTLPGLISQQSAKQGGAWLDVPDSRDWVGEEEGPQLRMKWPEGKQAPAVRLPSGYRLRQFVPADAKAYKNLMRRASFTDWSDKMTQFVESRTLQDGFFLICDRRDKPVATALANHAPTDWAPQGAEVGWVAVDPAHRGKGLGYMVSAAALKRNLSAGYKNIYLLTDDFRTPALKTYLKMGFEPIYFSDQIKKRWSKLLPKLK